MQVLETLLEDMSLCSKTLLKAAETPEIKELLFVNTKRFNFSS